MKFIVTGYPGKNTSYLLHFSLVNVFLTCNRVRLSSISDYYSLIGLRQVRWDGVCSDRVLGGGRVALRRQASSVHNLINPTPILTFSIAIELVYGRAATSSISPKKSVGYGQVAMG